MESLQSWISEHKLTSIGNLSLSLSLGHSTSLIGVSRLITVGHTHIPRTKRWMGRSQIGICMIAVHVLVVSAMFGSLD